MNTSSHLLHDIYVKRRSTHILLFFRLNPHSLRPLNLLQRNHIRIRFTSFSGTLTSPPFPFPESTVCPCIHITISSQPNCWKYAFKQFQSSTIFRYNLHFHRGQLHIALSEKPRFYLSTQKYRIWNYQQKQKATQEGYPM